MQGCRVGMGRVEITPSAPGACAGWSIAGPKRVVPPRHPDQALVATAMALEDDAGRRVVFVNADLHCGGAALWKALGRVGGLGVARVVLCGTHTHQGPAQRYGSLMYSAATTPSPFGVGASTRRLKPLLEALVQAALDDLSPGGVAVVRGVVPGAASNRATPCWRHVDAATREAFLGAGPGGLNPADAPLPDRLRDPRVTVLVARDDAGRLRGALAWFAVHGTALGPTWERFGADLWGPARRVAEAGLGVSVGFGGGSSGDISPLPLDEAGEKRGAGDGRPGEQGEALAVAVGEAIGGVVSAVATQAVAEAFTVGVAHELWRPTRHGLPRPRTGAATAGGGIDGPTPAWDQVKAGVGSPVYATLGGRAHPMTHPQGPKLDIQAAWTGLPVPIAGIASLAGPRELPLHVVRIGDHVFATVPGEPTTLVGWRLERAILEATGATSASVIGYAGDYAGYWVTPETYLEQRYEGASTLFGREASARLIARLASLAHTL